MRMEMKNALLAKRISMFILITSFAFLLFISTSSASPQNLGLFCDYHNTSAFYRSLASNISKNIPNATVEDFCLCLDMRVSKTCETVVMGVSGHIYSKFRYNYTMALRLNRNGSYAIYPPFAYNLSETLRSVESTKQVSYYSKYRSNNSVSSIGSDMILYEDHDNGYSFYYQYHPENNSVLFSHEFYCLPLFSTDESFTEINVARRNANVSNFLDQRKDVAACRIEKRDYLVFHPYDNTTDCMVLTQNGTHIDDPPYYGLSQPWCKPRIKVGPNPENDVVNSTNGYMEMAIIIFVLIIAIVFVSVLYRRFFRKNR